MDEKKNDKAVVIALIACAVVSTAAYLLFLRGIREKIDAEMLKAQEPSVDGNGKLSHLRKVPDPEDAS